MLAEVRLRPEVSADASFLEDLFASVRENDPGIRELLPKERALLLKEQCRIQRTFFENKFPNAHFMIIEVAGNAAGRYYVSHRPTDIHIIELSLMPEFRSHGIGSRLLSMVQQEASVQKIPIRLKARFIDQSESFYRKLGFVEVNRTDSHLAMEWRPFNK